HTVDPLFVSDEVRRLFRVYVPQDQGPVGVAGQQALAVRQPGQGGDPARMRAEDLAFAALQVPQPDGKVLALLLAAFAGGGAFAVAGEGEAADVGAVSFEQSSRLLLSLGVPHDNPQVAATAGKVEPTTARRQSQRPDGARMAGVARLFADELQWH